MNMTMLEVMQNELQRQDQELKDAYAPLAEHADVQCLVDASELEAIEASARPANTVPLMGAIRC